jgi:hypothetical protein
VLGAISLAMIALMISYGAASFFAVFIAVICGVGALYMERWVFDTQQGAAIGRTGLIFAAKEKRVDFENIAGVRVESPSPGAQRPARFMRLVLRLKDGDPVVMEVQRRGTHLKEYADRISAIAGIRRLDDSI